MATFVSDRADNVADLAVTPEDVEQIIAASTRPPVPDRAAAAPPTGAAAPKSAHLADDSYVEDYFDSSEFDSLGVYDDVHNFGPPLGPSGPKVSKPQAHTATPPAWESDIVDEALLREVGEDIKNTVLDELDYVTQAVNTESAKIVKKIAAAQAASAKDAAKTCNEVGGLRDDVNCLRAELAALRKEVSELGAQLSSRPNMSAQGPPLSASQLGQVQRWAPVYEAMLVALREEVGGQDTLLDRARWLSACSGAKASLECAPSSNGPAQAEDPAGEPEAAGSGNPAPS